MQRTFPLLLTSSLLGLFGCPDEPAKTTTQPTEMGSMSTDMDPARDAATDLTVLPPEEDLSTLADASRDMPEEEEIDMGPFVYPEPTAWSNRGPGLPKMTFAEEDLYQNCAFLDGTRQDKDHHNLVVMYDGYMLMPWAHEGSYGALTFFDMTDPCSPTKAGEQDSQLMRETHAIGFMHHKGKRWAVTEGINRPFDEGGLLFWDITDTANPKPAEAAINVPGFFYPDAYKRIILSAFWQGRYVYAAGSLNGIYVYDAIDPTAPELVNQYVFEPLMQAGQVQAVGNLLIVTTAEGRRAVLLDISDPQNPQPIPGGDFQILDDEGIPREAYFSNVSNGHLFFARKEGGGGLIIYDIRDPQNPTRAGSYTSDGSGGYVFVKDDFAFVGESRFAALYDVSDYNDIKPVTRFNLKGDLDTITPIGNLAILSVDDKAAPNEASAVTVWTTDPDTKPPEVDWMWPEDGAQNLPVTSRFGFMFNEMTDVMSAFEGSVRLYRQDAATPEEGRVPILVSTQENLLNVSPLEPLEPSTTYTLELLAGGITDYSGNVLQETLTVTYTTQSP